MRPGSTLPERVAVRIGRAAWAAAGVGMAFWLVYAELFRIDALCLWCAATHVLALTVFVVTALGTAADLEDAPGRLPEP